MYSRSCLFLSFLYFLIQPHIIFAAVVINEIQVEPASSQWVELYNTGPDTVDITGWAIDDNAGTQKFIIPASTALPVGTCISFQSGNFNWNTSSNDSALLLSGETRIDEYAFSKSPGDSMSFARNPDGTGDWTTSSAPSRDRLNSSGAPCTTPTPTPTIIPTATPTYNPTPTKSPTNTPTPTNTPIPTATPTSASTQAAATPTPAKKNIPTPTKVSITSTPIITPTQDDVLQGQILGFTDSPTPTPTDAPSDNRDKIKPLVLSLLFVALGLSILMGLFIWNKRSAMKGKKEDIL